MVTTLLAMVMAAEPLGVVITLPMNGTMMNAIDLVLKIRIDLRRTLYAVGAVNQRVYATTGVDGKSPVQFLAAI